LFLINNKQAQVPEPDVLANYAVCPDKDINFPLFKFFYDLFLVFGVPEAADIIYSCRKIFKSFL